MRKRLLLLLLAFIVIVNANAVERTKLNFNGGWLLKVGTIMWYRKHFHIQEVGDRKYFIEFEGGHRCRGNHTALWCAGQRQEDGIRCQPYRKHHSEESEYHSSRKEQRIEDHRRCQRVEITHTFYRK